jgi:hypothetical protein
MPLAAYPDVSFFIRAVRVLPVIAVAASAGGTIGGFTVYAVDSALTWQRPDLRAENQTASAEQQKTRPVRIVGGTIPDPSAGMSAPPVQPAPQSAAHQSSAQQNPSQLSPQILTGKPLGPAAPLQSQSAPQSASQPPNQAPSAKPVQTQSVPAAPPQQRADQAPNAAPTQQQPTRWPDALSRTRQSSTAQQQTQQQTTAPQPTASQPDTVPQASTIQNAERKNFGQNSGNEQAARAPDDDRAMPRRERRARRLDARAYDRFYNSYGYARGRDQSGGGSRYDAERRYGHYSRYRSRSREIVPERQDADRGVDSDMNRGQADQGNRERAIEVSRPRQEPFWGGGAFRRDDRLGDDD